MTVKHIPNKYLGQNKQLCILLDRLDSLIGDDFIKHIDENECVFQFKYNNDILHPTLIGRLTVYRQQEDIVKPVEVCLDYIYDNVIWFTRNNKTNDQKYVLCVSDRDNDTIDLKIDIQQPLISMNLHTDGKNIDYSAFFEISEEYLEDSVLIRS